MMRSAVKVIPAIGFAVVVFCSGTDAFAQKSVGRIHRFAGELEIQHEGHILVPTKMGPLFRNANIYSGDTIRVGKGAAELLFEDGALLKMDANTILQVDLVNLGVAGQKERNIKVMLGRIWCKVEPSETLRTVFEVPDGVAAVRGTTVEIWVDEAGNWQMFVHEGMMEVTEYRVTAMFSIPAGYTVWMTQISPREVEFGCGERSTGRGWSRQTDTGGRGPARNRGDGAPGLTVFFRPAPVRKPDGTLQIVPPVVRRFTGGDVFRVTRNEDGSYQFTDVKGSVAVFKIQPGEDTLLLPWWLEDPVIPRRLVGSPGAGEAGENGLPPATIINPGG